LSLEPHGHLKEVLAVFSEPKSAILAPSSALDKENKQIQFNLNETIFHVGMEDGTLLTKEVDRLHRIATLPRKVA
jgi:hypothetical protein